MFAVVDFFYNLWNLSTTAKEFLFLPQILRWLLFGLFILSPGSIPVRYTEHPLFHRSAISNIRKICPNP